MTIFNQQPNFTHPKDTTAELIKRERQQSQNAFNTGNLGQAVVLKNQADVREFGEVLLATPSKLRPISETTQSPGGTKIDAEFSAKLDQISRDIDNHDDPEALNFYMRQLDKTVPDIYANSPGSFTMPRAKDIEQSAEYRKWRRVHDQGAAKRNKTRGRSQSFARPEALHTPPKSKTYKHEPTLENVPPVPMSVDLVYGPKEPEDT